MLVTRTLNALHIKSRSLRLYLGAGFAAIAISLGTLWGAAAMGVSLGPAIPAALGAIGAALYAARSGSNPGDGHGMPRN